MRLTEVYAAGFRCFGEEEPLSLSMRPGINLVVGENDSGKTAIVDAIRLALGSRSDEYLRLSPDDFHTSVSAGRTDTLVVRCTLDDLGKELEARFLEWCVIEHGQVRLHVHLRGQLRAVGTGHQVTYNRRSGREGDGPVVDGVLREYLRATYLRPLRDAERMLRAGRRSRLSQILSSLPMMAGQDTLTEVAEGEDNPDPTLADTLSAAQGAVAANSVVSSVEERVNDEYLSDLLLARDEPRASLRFGRDLTVAQLLERLELVLHDPSLDGDVPHGLGMNNVLFMAAELLLLQSGTDQLPLLLIEEPEAHLHPQLQSRFMAMLESRLTPNNRPQVVLTTHSPLLAAGADLESVVICRQAKVYPLASGHTMLDGSDYGFLRRFLDATKANLFFARGVLVVEGDAENLLLPAIARKLGRSLASHGVSIVKVGHTGLFRYSRIFQRLGPPALAVPVACVTDLDIPPDEAAEEYRQRPPRRTQRYYDQQGRAEARFSARRREAGYPVEVFVSPQWTMEFDLALHGLASEVHVAVGLVGVTNNAERDQVIAERRAQVAEWQAANVSAVRVACRVYEPMYRSNVSKAMVAEQLAWVIHRCDLTPAELAGRLPDYIVDAIHYVTSPLPSPAPGT